MTRLRFLLAIPAIAAFAPAQCFETNFGTLMPRAAAPTTPGVGDDVLFDLQPLTNGVGGGIATFPMNATNYTHAHVNSNGVMYLTTGAASGASTTGYSTSATTIVTNLRGTAGQPPRIAPYWRDLNVTAANSGGVFFNNTIPGKFVVTWRNAVHFGQTTPVFTLQAQLLASGEVRIFYSNFNNTATVPICGISAGNLIADPGVSDLSVGSVGVSTSPIVYQTFATTNTFDLQNTGLSFVPNVGGGYDVIPSACVPASNTSYGNGCVTQARSFYQSFPTATNDLTGLTLTATPNLNGGYDVSSAALSTFNPPTVTGLALGDDAVSTQALPFTFDYPGSSTTSVTIDSNGRILLAATGSSSFSPSVSSLLTSTAALLCPCWQDLLPDGATNLANVYFEVVSATEVDITWLNVPCFSGGGVNTVQVALIDNGTNDIVEFRCQQAQNTNGTAAIVGFSTGASLGTSIDSGNADLSAGGISGAFPELGPLGLSASPSPVLGANVTWTVSNIRANLSLSAILLSFGQTAPVPLTTYVPGGDGCFVHIDVSNFFTFGNLLFLNPTDTFSLTLPTLPSWANVDLFFQAVSLTPGANAAGLINSNGLKMHLNTF